MIDLTKHSLPKILASRLNTMDGNSALTVFIVTSGLHSLHHPSPSFLGYKGVDLVPHCLEK